MSAWEKINWTQIIVTAFVTLAIAIASNMIVTYLQTSKPKLVYSTTETIPFSGEDQVMGIYQILIGNEGKKSTKDVICYVSISEASIEQWDISADPAISFTSSLTQDSLTIDFPLLNPSEFLSISILATHATQLPELPEVSLRAEGVSGVEKSTDEKQFLFLSSMDFIKIFAISILITGIIMTILRERTSPLEAISGVRVPTGEQHLMFAYLFGNLGMLDEMENYLRRGSKVSYWSEADRLGALAISSTDKSEIENIKTVLKNLLEYAGIAGRSKGIIYYNFARIEAHLGNSEEMRKFLDKAREKIPKLLEIRLKVDPVFKDIKIEE